jgi:TM2 domain-containing membrane protein YozV
MEIYIFGLGVFVICLVIASVFFVNHEETKKYNDIDEANEMDYDGMGNYGRFPKKK